jgi:hypothetical protein
MCPCNSLRIGTAMLAFAICMAMSGLPAVSPQTLIAAALHGELSIGMWLCVAFVAAGVWQFVAGLRAALSHNDPVSGWSLLLSSALLVLTVKTAGVWSDGRALHLPAYELAGVRAIGGAVVADCVANIWLQLRGPLGFAVGMFVYLLRPRASVEQPASEHDYTEEAPNLSLYAELLQRNAHLEREISRMAAAPREAETVLLYPGVARAIRAALHPDRFNSDADKRLATERFQTASALLERIGARR